MPSGRALAQPDCIRRRLETSLAAGDPGGEVALAWDTTPKVMILYQPDDPARSRPSAPQRSSPRSGPAPSPNYPAWAAPCTVADELLAAFTHPDVGNGPRNLYPK